MRYGTTIDHVSILARLLRRAQQGHSMISTPSFVKFQSSPDCYAGRNEVPGFLPAIASTVSILARLLRRAQRRRRRGP